MSKIEEVLKRLCPNGVERKPLVQAVSVKRGVRVVKQQLAETGVYPVYQNCLTAMGYYAESNCSGDTAFVIAAGAAGSVGYCDVDFWAADDCYYMVAPKEINNKFLYYTMKSKEPLLLSKVRKASVPRLARDVVESMEIPLPPRHVQDEIVKALDTMDAAVKALEKERAARQEQFEAVREKEMIECCSANVERISLSEMGEFFSGLAGKSKDDFVEGNAKFLSYMDVFVNSAAPTDVANFVRVMPRERQNQLKVGDIVFTGSSETKDEAGMTCVIQTEFAEPVYLNSFCFGLRPNVSVQMKPEFAKYVFRSVVVRNQIIRASNGVTRFNVSKEALKKVQIPIPSVAVQKKIAAQLDAFAAVVAALDEEIAARREQFAGWLEKLMKFDAREVAVA